MIVLGSHIEMKAPGYLEDAVKQTIANGANALMIYSGAPQNTYRKDINLFRIQEGQQLMKEHGIAKESLIVHAPYIINLANTTKQDTFDLAVSALTKELERCQALQASSLVLHPGSHVGAGIEEGIARIIEGLNLVLPHSKGVDILLETMSGKGSEVGFSFDQLKAIFDGVDDSSHLKICMDTCHLHDAGYDVSNFDSVLDEFETYFSLNDIRVIHMNDSKNVQGAKKDRHENYGFGQLGFDTLQKIIYHPRLDHVVKILETPYIEREFSPYQQEITMIKNNVYDASLFDDYRKF